MQNHYLIYRQWTDGVITVIETPFYSWKETVNYMHSREEDGQAIMVLHIYNGMEETNNGPAVADLTRSFASDLRRLWVDNMDMDNPEANMHPLVAKFCDYEMEIKLAKQIQQEEIDHIKSERLA